VRSAVIGAFPIDYVAESKNLLGRIDELLAK
jgi:hypothetical protein